jgi:uncharacterized protein
MEVLIRDAVKNDCKAICALNLAEVGHTSTLTEERLETLAALSCYHKVACVGGIVAAFLLALDNGAPYDNENFGWFARAYARFIYIDRVVVSSDFRGLRIGSRLYEDLIRYAQDRSISIVTCEYNLVPPNELSRLFHNKFGFNERGTRWAADGAKRVSLQVAEI